MFSRGAQRMPCAQGPHARPSRRAFALLVGVRIQHPDHTGHRIGRRMAPCRHPARSPPARHANLDPRPAESRPQPRMLLPHAPPGSTSTSARPTQPPNPTSDPARPATRILGPLAFRGLGPPIPPPTGLRPPGLKPQPARQFERATLGAACRRD